MKYPEHKIVIDVTKAPYNADNTGKIDCTAALRKAIDDCLSGYVTGFEKTREKLRKESNNFTENYYLGREIGRVINGVMTVTFPEHLPPSRILYFPEGTYLVSDTVTYTIENLNTLQQVNYICEMCRNIHILGESRENTVIKLADNSKGFEKGAKKPVLSFNRVKSDYGPTTNSAMLNKLESITVDCGKGNEGAVGVMYVSSNLGRIENVSVRSEGSYIGIEYDYDSEGCMYNIDISGFEYGMWTDITAPMILDKIDLSNNKIAGINTRDAALILKDVYSGDIPTLIFREGVFGRYYFENENITYEGELKGNRVYYETEKLLVADEPIPKNVRSKDFSDWVCVDDFGAKGDGITDSTKAIQAAMNSGKSVILFGEGEYLITKKINIPKTVQTVDFMYCDFVAGISLITGEIDCAFDINEESENTLFFENLFTHEGFYGYFRCFKHSAKRNIVFRDVLPYFASMYFNTIEGSGSKVYFDNCFLTTSSYTQDNCLPRIGYKPVFCKMIPLEFHGQKVIAHSLNPERAEVELLNDNSEIFISGYKTEGPGVVIKSINGGKTRLTLFNCGIWDNHIESNSIFEITDSSLEFAGGLIFWYNDDKKNNNAFKIIKNNEEENLNLFDCSDLVMDRFRIIDGKKI